MSEQQPEKERESLVVEPTELAAEPTAKEAATKESTMTIQHSGITGHPWPVDKFPQEWIPGEKLELVRIPPPTIWPPTVALGVTGIAFGVVTHWILSIAGLFLFLLGAAGWIEDLKKDVL